MDDHARMMSSGYYMTLPDNTEHTYANFHELRIAFGSKAEYEPLYNGCLIHHPFGLKMVALYKPCAS